jgi:hypothetical protein
MKRRDFIEALSGVMVSTAALGASGAPRSPAGWLLIPMDGTQTNHLKAYGVTFRRLERGGRAEWLLNYRGGSFLMPLDPESQRDATLAGVSTAIIDDSQVVDIRGAIEAGNMDAVPLEKAPEVAVYVPPNAAPWDDAVRMALEYAGIAYDRVWDEDVMTGKLQDYEWLHLHHEDFTGQFSKFYLSYSGSLWLAEMVQRNQQMARTLGFQHVAALKKNVALRIRDFVDNGGFLFAMCTATETLEIALAAQDVDVSAQYSDGTPMDPDASRKLQWQRTFAFDNVRLEQSPATASFSDIDGHQVNNPPKRQPLGSATLFNFSAKIDPVPTMLVQNHSTMIRDFYGLTTSFRKDRLKPGVTVLADEEATPWAKYVHGEFGEGTWTFLGGHDPEDPQHRIGDPPTDLSLFPNSPGYRLILNNVLFPAAKKRELKT